MRSLIMVIIYQKKSKSCQRIHNNECFSLNLNEQVAYIERSLWNILIFLSYLKELIFMQIRSKLPQFRWLFSTADYRFVYYHRSQLYLSAWLDCIVMNNHWDLRDFFKGAESFSELLWPHQWLKNHCFFHCKPFNQLNSWECHSQEWQGCVLAFKSFCSQPYTLTNMLQDTWSHYELWGYVN